MFSPAFLDWTLNQRLHGPIGNRDLFGAAPSGVYPARGEDRWIALAAEGDHQWRRLCELIGDETTMTDERFAEAASRAEHEDELDAIVAGWTRPHDNRARACRPQDAGIAAGPVLSAADAYEDPHLEAGGFFQPVSHPEWGPKTYRFPGMPFRYSNVALSIRKAPVALGEDNEYVYKQVLGYSDEEYAGFVERGHIGMDFDEGIR